MEPGASLGPYRIERELGAGGMGKVYAATLTREAAGLALGTTVALKVVHPHLLESEGFFKRFLREAQIGQSVLHDNVVRTLDCDAVAVGGVQHNFLVMEYVEGQTLADLQRELDKVPEELCRHIAREICKGLSAIHDAGVVHRDLKPENVLITPEYVVKVMDLGVARLADEALRLSQSGAFIGSVEYAAPEQFGGKVDHRCDLHALGLLLYELACGQHPYRGDSFPEVMKSIREDAPRPLGEVNPQLSPFFEEVVHTLLAKDRDERFADARELLAILEQCEESDWWHKRASVIRAATKRPLRRIRIPRETAVYGRDDELAKLREAFERAKTGEGRVVVLEGEAGIGKSRLIDELVHRLQEDGEDISFLFGSYPPGGAATAAGAFSTAFREHFGEAGSAAYLMETPVLVPAFDALLRGESAPSGVEDLTKDSLQTCFVNATRALATEHVTVVLIDDLHFAPEEGRALFSSLAMGVPGYRVLLVGTTRPGIDATWLSSLTRLEQTSQMALGRLGPKDLAELLKDSFRSEHLAMALAGQIGIKSDGNPFFAFEIIRGLREGQFITQRDDGTWVSTGVIDEIQIPSSVLDLVNARVADLSDEERDLLDVATCWGFEFDPALIGDVLGMARIQTLKRFGQIERKHRLVRAAGRRMVFDHHQVQEALYGSLLEQLREEYHAALADALESRSGAGESDQESLDGALCVDLCEHFLKGARGEKALRYLARAQDHLSQGSLHAQVVALTERTLDVPDLLSGIARARVLLRLAGTLGTMGRQNREEECAREAGELAEQAGDDELRGDAATVQGNVLARLGRFEPALTCLQRAIAIAQQRADRAAESRARSCLGVALLERGRMGEAEEQQHLSLSLSRDAGRRDYEAAALLNLGHLARGQGRLEEAHEYLERGLEIARDVGNRSYEANALVNLGVVLMDRGMHEAAIEHVERSSAAAREIGHRASEASALHSLGLIYQRLGRVEDARGRARRALDLYREIGSRSGEANAISSLANLAAMEGREKEAGALHEQHLALTQEYGFRAGEAGARVNLGRGCCRDGRLLEAREHLERGYQLFSEMGVRGQQAVALVNLASTWRLLGNLEQAEMTCEESLAIARDVGVPYPEGYALIILSRLAADRGEFTESLRFAEECLELRREIGHADGIVAALVTVADLYRRTGAAEAAKAAAEEALALAREQGQQDETVQSLALLACLPGGDAAAAEREFAEAGDRADTVDARWFLWEATRHVAHIAAGKRLIDEALAKVPDEYHEAMCTNVRVNREILAAWREEFGEEGDAPDAALPGESPTRPG